MAHVTSSVGWLGAVIAYLALAVAGLTRQDPEVTRAAYISLELIGWYAIVPLSLASVATGLIQSFATEWGLLRYYWIAAKFVLTLIATTVLLVHLKTVSRMASLAAATLLAGTDYRPVRVQLIVHAAGGLLVLLTATALSVYKPWGMTPYGRRKRDERRATAELAPAPVAAVPAVATTRPSLPWGKVIGVHVVVLVLLAFVVLHLAGGGLRHN